MSQSPPGGIDPDDLRVAEEIRANIAQYRPLTPPPTPVPEEIVEQGIQQWRQLIRDEETFDADLVRQAIGQLSGWDAEGAYHAGLAIEGIEVEGVEIAFAGISEAVEAAAGLEFLEGLAEVLLLFLV